MADYLMERGVEEDQLLLEERSHNTDQNLRYSRSCWRQRAVICPRGGGGLQRLPPDPGPDAGGTGRI